MSSVEATDYPVSMVDAPLLYKQWLILEDPHRFFDTLIQDYGDFVHYRGILEFYLVNDPELVKQILKQTNTHFDKQSPLYKRFHDIFRSGLVVSEGEHWKQQRKLMQPMFTPAAVKKYFSVMQNSLADLEKRWQKLTGKSRKVDLEREMSHFTLDVAGNALFSDGFKGMSDKIESWSHFISEFSAIPPIPVMSEMWFPAPRNLKMNWVLLQFHRFVKKMIKQRRKKKGQDDLLALLMETAEKDNYQLSDAELEDEVITMIFGGFETSSNALVWMWYLLDKHPQVEQRLLQELDEVLQGRAPTLQDLPKLVYTKAVVEEVLRLYPPFWFENRNTMCDVKMGDVVIPKGSLVVFSRYSLHRHSRFWDEPEAFRPERFLKDYQSSKENHHFASVPFGGGPRICIGINFAMMELILTAATLLPKFKPCIDRKHRYGETSTLTLEPKHGMKATIESRESACQ